MPFFLAGLASMSFGVADFFGGMATRRAPALSVVLFSQLVGGIGILAVAPLFDPVGDLAGFAWGAAAGIAGAVGLTVLYTGLATMRIGIVAPVTSLVGTATPVVFGVLAGERPSVLAWVGIPLAIAAVVFIASPGPEASDTGTGGLRAVAIATLAGVAFGLFGVFIAETSGESGLWPLVGARGASVAMVLVAVLVRKRPLIPAQSRGQAAVAGALDMAANVLFLLAVRRELLSLVAVIMSMYPAATIALARVVYQERIGIMQAVGLAVGAVGVTLIVLG